MNIFLHNKKIQKMLENCGWIVECEHPMELVHATNEGTVKGNEAAQMVAESLAYNVASAVLDYKISQWHKNYQPGTELHVALGLTPEAYRDYVKSPYLLDWGFRDTLIEEYNKRPSIYKAYF